MAESDNDFFDDVVILLLAIMLAIIFVPILIGIIIALLCGISGMLFYGVVIIFSFAIWTIIGLLFWN